jgi:hypothetical protein
LVIIIKIVFNFASGRRRFSMKRLEVAIRRVRNGVYISNLAGSRKRPTRMTRGEPGATRYT